MKEGLQRKRGDEGATLAQGCNARKVNCGRVFSA